MFVSAALEKPLRFPCRPDEVSAFKVDLLDLRGSGRVPFDFGEESFRLPLDPVEEPKEVNPHQQMEVEFAVRSVTPEGPDSTMSALEDSTRHRKADEAQGYLEEHGLLPFLQFLLQGLMQDKPADPYAFLRKQIDLKLQRRPMTGDRSTLPGSSHSRRAEMSQVHEAEMEAVDDLIHKLTPRGSTSVPSEELVDLERQAEEARRLLEADNARLRDELKEEYEQLMRQTARLQATREQLTPFDGLPGHLRACPPDYWQRLYRQFGVRGESPTAARSDQARAATAPATAVLQPGRAAERPSSQKQAAPGTGGSDKPPRTHPKKAIFTEIAQLQSDIEALVQENGGLVADLTRTRDNIELVVVELANLPQPVYG